MKNVNYTFVFLFISIIKACSVTQVLADLKRNEVTFPLTRVLIHLAI